MSLEKPTSTKPAFSENPSLPKQIKSLAGSLLVAATTALFLPLDSVKAQNSPIAQAEGEVVRCLPEIQLREKPIDRNLWVIDINLDKFDTNDPTQVEKLRTGLLDFTYSAAYCYRPELSDQEQVEFAQFMADDIVNYIQRWVKLRGNVANTIINSEYNGNGYRRIVQIEILPNPRNTQVEGVSTIRGGFQIKIFQRIQNDNRADSGNSNLTL